MSTSLRIGTVASRTGVTVETLRYYERRGLLHPVARREGGYREYGDEAVTQVQFIKRAQALGFTLTEVAELLRLRRESWTDDSTNKLRAAAISKIEDIDRRVAERTHNLRIGSDFGEEVMTTGLVWGVFGAFDTNGHPGEGWPLCLQTPCVQQFALSG